MSDSYRAKEIITLNGVHTLINNGHIFKKAFITCGKQLAIKIKASTVIITDSSSLKEVIQFYKDYSYKIELTLLATSHHDVIIGMDEGIKIHFKGSVIKYIGTSKKDFVLERFKYLAKNDVYDYASKALFYLLTDFPFTSTENAVNALYSLNNELDKAWALNRAIYMMNEKEKRLLSRKKITNKGYIKSWAPILKPKSYLDGQVGNIFIENGSTGTGKSQKIREVVKASLKKGMKSVFICHRKSISSTSLQKINGVGYYDQLLPGQEANIQCLVVVVNSILKSNFALFLSQVDLVILEEGRQVFDHIMVGKCEKPEEVYNKVLNLCHQASSVVIADADANNDTLAFAQQLKNKPDVRLLYNEADFSDITVELCRYEYIKYKINAAAKAASFTPFIVSTDNQGRVNKLPDELLKLNPALSILTIHGDNNKEDEQQAFLKSPDVIAENYDVIIYNSAITSSVSITTDRFTKHFGLFQGIVTSSNTIQMLRRNRPCKHFSVGIKKPYYFPNDNPKEITQTKNEFELKCALLQCEENFDKNNITSSIYFSARHEGFNVTINHSQPPVKEEPTNKQKISKETVQLHNLFILRSNIKGCQHYDQQDKRSESKQKNMALCHEFYLLIFDTLGINIQTADGGFTQVEASLLLDKIYEREGDFKKTKLIKLPRAGKPKISTNTINIILSQFGLKAKRAVSSSGKYEITKDSITKMNDLLIKNTKLKLVDIK